MPQFLHFHVIAMISVEKKATIALVITRETFATDRRKTQRLFPQPGQVGP